MKRIFLALALACWGFAAAAAPVTFNPADQSGMTLSNGNLTATASPFSPTSVRSTTSYTTAKVCFEAVANTIGPFWTLGVADATFNLANPGGVGVDTHAIGTDVNNAGALQGSFYNNTVLGAVGAAASPSGEAVTICVSLSPGANAYWVSTATMRAASHPWNNSGTANPATNTGGLAFNSISCPCFIIFNEGNEAGVATLNATGPFVTGTPAGFSPWQAAAGGNHAMRVIMGSRKQAPHPFRPELRYAVFEQRRRGA